MNRIFFLQFKIYGKNKKWDDDFCKFDTFKNVYDEKRRVENNMRMFNCKNMDTRIHEGFVN